MTFLEFFHLHAQGLGSMYMGTVIAVVIAYGIKRST